MFELPTFKSQYESISGDGLYKYDYSILKGTRQRAPRLNDDRMGEKPPTLVRGRSQPQKLRNDGSIVENVSALGCNKSVPHCWQWELKIKLVVPSVYRAKVFPYLLTTINKQVNHVGRDSGSKEKLYFSDQSWMICSFGEIKVSPFLEGAKTV